MALAALVPGVPAAVLSFALGSIVHVGVGASAAIGAVVAVGGFCAQVLALGWARRVSPTANQAVAYTGFLLLIGLAVVAFVVLRAAASWFAPKAFWGGLFALVPSAAYVTHLARRGRIAELIVDADRAATAARSKERT
jgi:hypothetical protein